MAHLHMEELESRQLLSHGGALFQPPPAKPFGTFAPPAAHAPLIHPAHDLSPAAPGRPESAGAAPGSLRTFVLVNLDGRGADESVEDEPRPGPGGGGLEKRSSEPALPGKDTLAHCQDALGLAGNNRLSLAFPPGVPLQPASDGYGMSGAFVVMSVPPAVANAQLRFLPPSPTGNHSLPVEMPTTDAVVPPAGAGTGRQDAFAVAGSIGEGSWERTRTGADTATSVRIAETSEPPIALAAATAAVILPLDPAVLEQGMRRFLERLEQTGQHLVTDLGDAKLSPWIVTVAAAATACEIARRQLRTSPREKVGPAVDRLSGFAPDHPFAG